MGRLISRAMDASSRTALATTRAGPSGAPGKSPKGQGSQDRAHRFWPSGYRASSLATGLGQGLGQGWAGRITRFVGPVTTVRVLQGLAGLSMSMASSWSLQSPQRAGAVNANERKSAWIAKAPPRLSTRTEGHLPFRRNGLPASVALHDIQRSTSLRRMSLY